MGQTTFANSRGIAHKGSGGMSTVFPDVCKTPVPVAGVIPIPYPNIGMASDTNKGPKKVTTDKKMPMVKGANYKQTSGDEAGVQKGVISSKTKGEAEFLMYSFDVKFEGKNVCRLGDPMFHNKKNIMG
jgi:hypothetical protein